MTHRTPKEAGGQAASGASAGRNAGHWSFGLADIANLSLLFIAMAFYWHLWNRSMDGDTSSFWTLPYFFVQGVFFWYLASRSAALLPLGPRGAKIAYAAFFTLLYAVLAVNYQCFALMQVHLHPSLVQLVVEPGFFADLTIGPGQLLLFATGMAVLFSLQILLLSFGARYGRGVRFATATHGTTMQLLCLAGFLATWTLWSYANFADRIQAGRDTKAVPLFLPRSIDMGMSYLWAWLGVDQVPIPPGRQPVTLRHESLVEADDFRNFRRTRRLPAGLSAKHDWNILVLAAESWRWDMFTPEIMPRLWAIAQRRGWFSSAHYSTGNSTSEALHGLFSGQAPLYWSTGYKHRLRPVFFDILKRLGYRTSVLSSSQLSYREIDEYIFGQNIDSLEILEEPPSRLRPETPETEASPSGREPAERHRKELWDLAVTERYLADLDRRQEGKYFDFLFFYSTHYKYFYPDDFERFAPAAHADFALFNFYLELIAPRLLNRYRNASHYLDFLFSRILQELEQRRELDRTIVVITGDHGEEFFEAGRFGHSMALNDYQTRVPLVLFFPERPAIDYTITSHADVVPTILRALGTDPALQRFFTGKDLLRYDADRNAALVLSLMRTGTPVEFALVREGHKTIFVNGADHVSVQRILRGEEEVEFNQARGDRDLRYILSLKKHFSAAGADGPGRWQGAEAEDGASPPDTAQGN